MPATTPTASPEAIVAARTIARAICVEYRLTPEAYDRHGGEHPIIPVIVRHVAPALQGIATPADKADNPKKRWDALSEIEKAVVLGLGYSQSPNSYSADEKAFVFSLLDDALKQVWWAAVPNADGWLDMSSAPLTGRKVDLWVRPHDALANGNPDRIADAWYEDGKWMRIVTGSGKPAPVEDCGVPTHWRLPPAAPGSAPEVIASADTSWLRAGRAANELQSEKIDAHREFVRRAAVHHAGDRSYLNGVRGGFFDAAHLVDICRKEIEETGRPSKAKAVQVDLLQRVGDTIWGLKDVLPEPPAPATAEVRRNA